MRGRAGGRPTLSWVVPHYRALQVGGAVIGAVLLLVIPGWWIFVVAALLIAYEVALWRIAATRSVSQAPLAPAGRPKDESLSKPAATAP